MKKLVTLLAVVAFMFSVDANAQTPKQKKKEAKKTEKAACATEDKKACGTEAKASCCSSKKAEAKKED
ncbi:hypothetical protein [uncultured Flavobacterium sp.]|uniref:hypothetical protein n=1 Tax=uncultured Flavobacterium sp. TaxID=165435 RepID=UPI0030EBAE09|tara:strand:- start:197738 stop:197941 length:204 start_codon:yes stop_codon:yes gene_type:complete